MTHNYETILDNNLIGFFFQLLGQQVVEEILDAQRGGCPREYENVPIPEDHEFRKMHPELTHMPFIRTRHSFDTGFSPNVPREQVCLLCLYTYLMSNFL